MTLVVIQTSGACAALAAGDLEEAELEVMERLEDARGALGTLTAERDEVIHVDLARPAVLEANRGAGVRIVQRAGQHLRFHRMQVIQGAKPATHRIAHDHQTQGEAHRRKEDCLE